MIRGGAVDRSARSGTCGRRPSRRSTQRSMRERFGDRAVSASAFRVRAADGPRARARPGRRPAAHRRAVPDRGMRCSYPPGSVRGRRAPSFQSSYAASWGLTRGTRPSPGSRRPSRMRPAFSVVSRATAPRATADFDVGRLALVALNRIARGGGCDEASPQERSAACGSSSSCSLVTSPLAPSPLPSRRSWSKTHDACGRSSTSEGRTSCCTGPSIRLRSVRGTDRTAGRAPAASATRRADRREEPVGRSCARADGQVADREHVRASSHAATAGHDWRFVPVGGSTSRIPRAGSCQRSDGGSHVRLRRVS